MRSDRSGRCVVKVSKPIISAVGEYGIPIRDERDLTLTTQRRSTMGDPLDPIVDRSLARRVGVWRAADFHLILRLIAGRRHLINWCFGRRMQQLVANQFAQMLHDPT